MLRKTLVTLSLWIWGCTLALLILGGWIHSNGRPGLMLECPTTIWDAVNAGGLERSQVFDNPDAYGCNGVTPEYPPYESLPWMFFGALTGFAIGSLTLKTVPNTNQP